MKKIALMLAALTAVSAVASAKEVVAAPVIVEEVVVIAPVAKWRPSGFADINYTYYGQDEYDSSDFGRVQLEGLLNFSEKESIEYRVRFYNSYITNASLKELIDAEQKQIGDFGDAIQGRLRYNYNNGELGNSGITLMQRVQYKNEESIGSALDAIYSDPNDPALTNAIGGKFQELEYRLMFDFGKHMEWTPEWFKNTSLAVEPYYAYGWTDATAVYTNELGLKLGATFDLPAGFSIETNLYPTWSYGRGLNDDQERVDVRGFGLAYEAYLYYGANLYKGEKTSLDFNFEGGIDPSTFHSDRSFGKVFSTTSDATYSAYAKPSVEISYQRSEFVKLYAGVAGEYRNWRNTNMRTAKNWDWMPQAYAGFRVNF